MTTDTGWLAGLARLSGGSDSAVQRLVAGEESLEETLEEVVLGARRTLTRRELEAVAGLDPDEARRLWRSLGFAEVPDDEVLFNERDVAAVRLMGSLTEAGVLTPDVREAVARATAQATSRLAEWQVGMLRRLIESGGRPLTPEQALLVAGSVLPVLEELQTYVWRRHLVSAISRMLVASHTAAQDGTETLVVGFADMVGFTRTTRQRSVAQLSEMIERFGACTTEVIAERRGRIVKTVGDEVLFVADDVSDGVQIALALRERVREEPALPQLRIGLAAGPVLVRYGDVFGEVVNIAARLTSHARPDSVLVDRAVAEALTGNPRYVVTALRPLAVRGYRHLHPWRLEPAQ